MATGFRLDTETSRRHSNPPSVRHPERQFGYSDLILLPPPRAQPLPPAPRHRLGSGRPLPGEALPRRLDPRSESRSCGQDAAHRRVLLGANVFKLFKLAFT